MGPDCGPSAVLSFEQSFETKRVVKGVKAMFQQLTEDSNHCTIAD
jgi:hypothetical protein